jgi:hypothetical protein
MPIFLDPDDFSPGPLRIVPRVLNADGSVQHVYCDGARFHVLSWSTQGRHCSEPDCEVNRERESRAVVEEGEKS